MLSLSRNENVFWLVVSLFGGPSASWDTIRNPSFSETQVLESQSPASVHKQKRTNQHSYAFQTLRR